MKSDFEFSPIPRAERRSFLSIAAVWTGFVLVTPNMLAGGALAEQFSLRDILLLALVGNLALAALAAITATMAFRSGLSFALLMRHTFGGTGSRIATLFVPLVNTGWYAIQSALVGIFIVRVLMLPPSYEPVFMVGAALIMASTSYLGYGALTKVSYVALPALLILVVVAIVKSVQLGGGLPIVLATTSPRTSTWTAGFLVVIGTWIFSSLTVIADIMRFARSAPNAWIATAIGLLVGNGILIAGGALAAHVVGNADMAAELVALGLVWPGLILLIANIWTTNDSNMYSSSLHLSNSFQIRRRSAVVAAAVAAAALTLARPQETAHLIDWLVFLGKIAPPLAGVVFADFFIVSRMRYGIETLRRAFNGAAFAGWALGLAVGFLVPWGLAPLNGLLAAGLGYILIYRVFPAQRDGNAAAQASEVETDSSQRGESTQ